MDNEILKFDIKLLTLVVTTEGQIDRRQKRKNQPDDVILAAVLINSQIYDAEMKYSARQRMWKR